MVLIIGGFAAGKRQYVIEKYGQISMSDDIYDDAKVLFDLQNCEQEYSEQLISQILRKKIVICNEIGCGIVPICEKERKKRENIGKITQELAKNATEVIRVYCGVGQKIK